MELLRIWGLDYRRHRDESIVLSSRHINGVVKTRRGGHLFFEQLFIFTLEYINSQVAKLFENQDDLLAEFGQFLPDAKAVTKPAERHYPHVRSPTPAAHHQVLHYILLAFSHFQNKTYLISFSLAQTTFVAKFYDNLFTGNNAKA